MFKQTLQRAAWALLGVALCLSYFLGHEVARAGDVTSSIFANADEAIRKAVTRADAPSIGSGNTTATNSEGWMNTGVYDAVNTRWRADDHGTRRCSSVRDPAHDGDNLVRARAGDADDQHDRNVHLRRVRHDGRVRR